MHFNLYAAVLNVNLLRLIYGFKSSLGLNWNFQIKFVYKLVMNLNLNVDFFEVKEFEFGIRTEMLKARTGAGILW